MRISVRNEPGAMGSALISGVVFSTLNGRYESTKSVVIIDHHSSLTYITDLDIGLVNVLDDNLPGANVSALCDLNSIPEKYHNKLLDAVCERAKNDSSCTVVITETFMLSESFLSRLDKCCQNMVVKLDRVENKPFDFDTEFQLLPENKELIV